MKEITYGDLLDCYNTLLEYAGRNYNHLLDAERQAASLQGAKDDDEIRTPAGIAAAIGNAEEAAEEARRKVDAARQIIADFYFEGDTADTQDAIMAMAEYLDYEDKAADALAAWAPPIKKRGTAVIW